MYMIYVYIGMWESQKVTDCSPSCNCELEIPMFRNARSKYLFVIDLVLDIIAVNSSDTLGSSRPRHVSYLWY